MPISSHFRGLTKARRSNKPRKISGTRNPTYGNGYLMLPGLSRPLVLFEAAEQAPAIEHMPCGDLLQVQIHVHAAETKNLPLPHAGQHKGPEHAFIAPVTDRCR